MHRLNLVVFSIKAPIYQWSLKPQKFITLLVIQHWRLLITLSPIINRGSLRMTARVYRDNYDYQGESTIGISAGGTYTQTIKIKSTIICTWNKSNLSDIKQWLMGYGKLGCMGMASKNILKYDQQIIPTMIYLPHIPSVNNIYSITVIYIRYINGYDLVSTSIPSCDFIRMCCLNVCVCLACAVLFLPPSHSCGLLSIYIR